MLQLLGRNLSYWHAAIWFHLLVSVKLVRLEEVVIEVALRGERLAAALRLAMVWLLSRVQPQMSLEIAFLVERLVAIFERADEVLRPIVLLQVHFEALLPTVRLVAALDRTDKVFELHVRFCVVPQVALRHERLGAPRV